MSILVQYADLVDAIVHRRVLVIRYLKDPTTGGRRTIHPHVLYESSPGKICLHAVQLDGDTGPGQTLPGWRPFNVDFVTIESVSDQHFVADPLLNLANASFYRRVYADCVNGAH